MTKLVRPKQETSATRDKIGSLVQGRAINFSGVKKDDRFAVWDEFLTSNISRHIRHPAGEDFFDGNMSKSSLGLLTLFNTDSSPYTSMVTNEIISARGHKEKFILIVPKRGEFILQQDGHVAHVRVGEMALLDSRLTGSITGLGSSAQTMIVVDRTKWEEQAAGPTLDANFKVEPSRVTSRLARAYIDELESCNDDIRPDGIELISRQLLELLSLYFEGECDSAPGTINRHIRLRKLKSFIRHHISDQKLSPASIADYFNISPRYISKLFESDGTTLMEYIQQIRLQSASLMLRNGSGMPISIKDISHRIGFRSQSHFSTRFSEKYGVSPSDYRRLHLQGLWREPHES